jgi:nitrogen fixation/metabolism regulation signal transduction histidine kinase
MIFGSTLITINNKLIINITTNMFLSDSVKEVVPINNKVDNIIGNDKDNNLKCKTISSIEDVINSYNKLPFYKKIFVIFSTIKRISQVLNNNK